MRNSGLDRILVMLIIWLTLCMVLASRALSPVQRTTRAEADRPRGNGECGSIDIRNHVENFMQLENCTVIEGELHILLIDYAETADYNHLHFPKLREITDHFLLYRVYGLKSLRHIFPNLAVIRGQNLFSNYALIAFEMPNLEELGLVSLTVIPRGAIRLEKNPELCFVQTVDWTKIATGVPMEDNFFKGNKIVTECVSRCPDKCPKTVGDDGNLPRCWTINDCQKMLDCPSNCKFCNSSIDCCDSNCLGGCSGPTSSDCYACKDVIDYPEKGPKTQPICSSRCSPGTFKYKDRRCLLGDQCKNFTEYKIRNQLYLYQYKKDLGPSQGECVSECPAGFEKNESLKTCIKCPRDCPKVCTGKLIDSINAAQSLKGCTKITGPIGINILGGSHVGRELEESLGDIVEVEDFIRIYHSYTMLSLHCFKSLKRIKGKKLYQNSYALVLYDNLNLQELFLDSVAKNLVLENGTVFFHQNRKLCLKKIDDFVMMIGHINKLTDESIDRDTNGDQTPCDIRKLDFRWIQLTPHIAILQWTNFNVSDRRQLISYSINYKEAPVKNISIYKGRDVCSNDLWKVVEVQPDDDEKAAYVHHFITDLDPWTQYAAYVETLTTSTAIKGAISDVIYFRTAAHLPTSPVKLKVTPDSPGRLLVTWEPPKHPNGNVTHYEVYWQYRNLDPNLYELRDYCKDPLMSSYSREDLEDDDSDETNTTRSANCCKCPKSQKQLGKELVEREMEIKFQDFLQNEVYLKRLDKKAASTVSPGKRHISRKHGLHLRNRRPAGGNNPPDPSGLGSGDNQVNAGTTDNYEAEEDKEETHTYSDPPTNDTKDGNSSDSGNHTEIVKPKKKENPFFKAVVYDLKTVIPNLPHFADYNIEVIACQEKDFRKPENSILCSNRAIGSGRTLPNPTSDTINETTVAVKQLKNNTNAVRITWEDPDEPNGLLITYEIEYKKASVANIKPLLICLPYKDYRDIGKGGHVLEKLDAGNYTFRIRATSLAGNGSWTEGNSFLIPSKDSETTPKETLIAVLLAVSVAVILISVAVVWFIAKKKFGNRLPKAFQTSANPDYMLTYAYVADEWEVDRDKVELLLELGQGSFGMVYEGRVKQELDGKNTILNVAIKTTNVQSNDADRFNFLQEASTMKAFTCHHVVQLLGVVSKGQPALVLMELMEKGDLKNFLRLHRPDDEENEGREPPTLKQIMQMAGEIADGMSYLADKKYVHRDLAARNCMVAKDMTVKIGDFGMTRDIYETDYYRKGNRGLLPVRWMSPESLKDGLFTSMSDVWSFGVVLWEMATLAAQPYQGLSNEEVLRYVGSGRIMDKPEGCPPKLFDLMMKCWRYRHKQRPTFKEIIELLLPDLDKNFKVVSYFFSDENVKTVHNDNTPAIPDHHSESADEPLGEEDFIDEANQPFLGASAAATVEGVPLEDIFTDSGGYPWAPKTVGSEMCDCTTLLQEIDEGAAAQSMDVYRRQSSSSNPNCAIGGSSSDGSKESSKSSGSSYAHMNGLSVANGHVPLHVRTTPC